ncbi:MAG: hypothetical protein AB7O59_16335 [Pirellulales bacterium]
MPSTRAAFWLRSSAPWAVVAAALACAALAPQGLFRRAAAEDVVVLRPTKAGDSPRSVSGQILDYTGRELRLRLPSGRERVIGPSQIERIKTDRTADQAAGDELFAKGDLRRAEARYRAAIDADHETRPWVRRQIVAQLVWCYQGLGQWEQAGELFLALLEGDPATPYFECIPLAWTTAQPTSALATKARTWLIQRERPAMALVGASHLLASPDRNAALARLRQLMDSEDPRIAWLAQTQIWRAESVRATPADLARWSRFVEEGDETLRAGPYFVLGSALAAHDPAASALALLEVPIMYPRQRGLAPAALLAAAAGVEKTGATRQAAGLYRELIDQYPSAAETGAARRRLDELARPPARPAAAPRN